MINGRLYDWQSVTITMPSGEIVGISEINYTDELGVEARYGKGVTPRGYGVKNYKASGSMTLDTDEYDRLRTTLGGRVYGQKFNIVVEYANDDQGIQTDTLRDCMIVKVDSSAKQDDDNAGARKIDITILSPIEWNGVPAL